MRSLLLSLAVLGLGSAPVVAAPPSGSEAYEALGIRPQQVLTGTVLHSKVLAGDAKQVVCLATYLTGKSEQSDAVNVRLGVFDVVEDRLGVRYQRDFGAERGGHVAAGELQLLDVDLDGINEIVVSFETFKDPLVRQRVGEVIVGNGGGLSTAWSDVLEYDATKAARSVPADRRDRFVREFDWGKTMRTRGATLFVQKKVLAVAGETLDPPRLVQETFRLRGAQDW